MSNAAETSPVQMDSMTKRPRTPNDPYTHLNDEQIKNIRQKPDPFFNITKRKYDNTRHFVPRYCQTFSQYNIRGTPISQRFGWIDEQYDRVPPEKHNTCRGRASVRWGPQKTGEATRSHFFGETIDRYTLIDAYRRNPTNLPGRVVMDHGRPADGYYAQKNPSRTTWFGSTAPLHRGFPNLRRKTYAEYETLRQAEEMAREMRREQFPEMSEYTDSYLCRPFLRPPPPVIRDPHFYNAWNTPTNIPPVMPSH